MPKPTSHANKHQSRSEPPQSVCESQPCSACYQALRHPHCVMATECGATSRRTCSAGDAGSDHAESVRPRLPLGSASMHFTLCPATCRTRSKACTPAPDETCNSSRHMQIGFPVCQDAHTWNSCMGSSASAMLMLIIATPACKEVTLGGDMGLPKLPNSENTVLPRGIRVPKASGREAPGRSR